MFELEDVKPAAALGYALLFWHHCDDFLVSSGYFLMLAASITKLPVAVRKTASAMFISNFTVFQPGEFTSEWLSYIAHVLVLSDKSWEARHFILVAYLLAIPREGPIPALAHTLLAWSAFDIIQSSDSHDVEPPPPTPSPAITLPPTSPPPVPTTTPRLTMPPLLAPARQPFPSYIPSFLFRLDSSLSTSGGQRL